MFHRMGGRFWFSHVMELRNVQHFFKNKTEAPNLTQRVRSSRNQVMPKFFNGARAPPILPPMLPRVWIKHFYTPQRLMIKLLSEQNLKLFENYGSRLQTIVPPSVLKTYNTQASSIWVSNIFLLVLEFRLSKTPGSKLGGVIRVRKI